MMVVVALFASWWRKRWSTPSTHIFDERERENMVCVCIYVCMCGSSSCRPSSSTSMSLLFPILLVDDAATAAAVAAAVYMPCRAVPHRTLSCRTTNTQALKVLSQWLKAYCRRWIQTRMFQHGTLQQTYYCYYIFQIIRFSYRQSSWKKRCNQTIENKKKSFYFVNLLLLIILIVTYINSLVITLIYYDLILHLLCNLNFQWVSVSVIN